MFASVSSCLTWNAVKDSHWSGLALWYSSIILAVACIFTGSQQSLVLPNTEILNDLSADEIESMKKSFARPGQYHNNPSTLILFAWQVPIMLLGYSVVGFFAGLCSVVLSPLARNPRWGEEAKVRALKRSNRA